MNYNQLPAIDKKTMNSLKDLETPSDNGAFINELIDTFLDNSVTLIDELLDSLSKNDQKKITYYSHRLKGLCANMGALQLKTIFAHIEKRELDFCSDQDMSNAIHKAFEQAKQELESRWRN